MAEVVGAPQPVPSARPIIGTSWKMNLTRPEARTYLRALRNELAAAPDARLVFVLPPFTSIAVAEEELAGTRIAYGAQDVHPADAGAHTGDVSALMLAELGCHIIEVGHSERRRDHCETDELIGRKVKAILRAGLWPLVCVGESAEEHAAGREEASVERQLQGALGELDARALERLMVAYEPWWAIGAGARAAPVEHVARLHAFISSWLDDADRHATTTPVLYGGSVDVGNAAALLSVRHVDGLFVGRSALDPLTFAHIAQLAPLNEPAGCPPVGGS